LFGASDPLGKAVKINGVNFSIIGITKSKGDQGWFNPDNQLFVPYLVAMKQLFGVEKLKEIDVQTFDDADATQIQASITHVLRRRHKSSPEVENDFNVRTQAEILETAGSFTDTFRLLLSGIGSISLLVGGIGIMNIMLVSVKERTREIGIRKAIGAKDRDILGQFLVEAVVLSGTGGAMGVVLGVAGAFLIGKVTSFLITIDYSAILLSLATATCIGIFFGYYPAWRAANLNPIDALRYE
jgi:putative ABC transport system permease protein